MIIRLIVYETEDQEALDKPLVDERLEAERIPPLMVELQELLEESWLGEWELDDA